MGGRGAAQFAAVSLSVSVTLLILGQFNLSRLGWGPEYAFDLRPWAVTAATLLLVPWWLTLHISRTLLRRAQVLLAMLVAFALYMAVSTGWAEGATIEGATLLDLAILIWILALFLMPFTVDPVLSARMVLLIVAFISWIYTAGGLAVASSMDRLSILGGGPNIYGRVVGLGVVATVALVVARKLPTWVLLLVPFQMAAVVLSGSRGAMLSTLLALAVVTLPRARLLFSPRILIVAVLAVLVAWRLLGAQVAAAFEERVVVLTLEEGHTAGRESLASIAMRIFAEQPLVGGGLGTFQARAGVGEYAHNIVLQVLAEGGLIGLALLALTLAPSLFALFKVAGRSDMALGLLGLSVLILCAAMFSGSYYDFRLMWAFAFAGALVARHLTHGSKVLPDQAMPASGSTANARSTSPGPRPERPLVTPDRRPVEISRA